MDDEMVRSAGSSGEEICAAIGDDEDDERMKRDVKMVRNLKERSRSTTAGEILIWTSESDRIISLPFLEKSYRWNANLWAARWRSCIVTKSKCELKKMRKIEKRRRSHEIKLPKSRQLHPTSLSFHF